MGHHDVGAVFHATTVVIGDRLGLYVAMADCSPVTASTTICTPASRSQPVGAALGAQAGESRLLDVVTAGGFTRFRRVAETPFNLVLEARP